MNKLKTMLISLLATTALLPSCTRVDDIKNLKNGVYVLKEKISNEYVDENAKIIKAEYTKDASSGVGFMTISKKVGTFFFIHQKLEKYDFDFFNYQNWPSSKWRIESNIIMWNQAFETSRYDFNYELSQENLDIVLTFVEFKKNENDFSSEDSRTKVVFTYEEN